MTRFCPVAAERTSVQTIVCRLNGAAATFPPSWHRASGGRSSNGAPLTEALSSGEGEELFLSTPRGFAATLCSVARLFRSKGGCDDGFQALWRNQDKEHAGLLAKRPRPQRQFWRPRRPHRHRLKYPRMRQESSSLSRLRAT